MSNRIQREVDELLSRLDQFPPKKPASRRIRDAITRPFRSLGRAVSGFRLPAITAGHVLLAAIIIIVVAYVAGGDSGIWTYIIAAGVLLFVLAFVMSLRRQSGGGSAPKYWRDRPLDLKRGGGGDERSWWDRWRGRR